MILLDLLNLLILVLAVAAYLVIIFGLLFENDKNNFVAMLLWFLLDAIALYGTYRSKEESLILIVFTCGTLLISLILLAKRQYEFNSTEKITSVLVMLCFILSQVTTGNTTLIIASITIFIAGVPYLKFLYDEKKVNIRIKSSAILFLVGSLVSLCVALMEDKNPAFPISSSLFWVIGCPIVFLKKKRS